MKGNVINVLVDIQSNVSCLPGPMDENFTIAVQLKKKLSYKKVDFKENVIPLRVLTALYWVSNESELYKKIRHSSFRKLLKVQKTLTENFGNVKTS